MGTASTPEFDHDVDSAVVTGATGTVGSRVVERLAAQGVHVVGVDVERPDGGRSNAEFRDVDLRNQGETWETIHEADPDAVIHCAAISDPLETPGTRVFESNAVTTYTTLVAAGRVGAEVVWTSSQAAYGALFARHDWVPDYLPIDEEHPLRPEDPYGVSKQCGEAVAAMMARRFDLPVTTIRPATVFTPDADRARPPKETLSLSADPVGGNFGSYVDVRDLVRLIEAALAADRDGHEVVLCAADENYLGESTAEIVESICGTLPETCDLDGMQAALSNARAADRLGWEPRFSKGDADRTDASPPSWL